MKKEKSKTQTKSKLHAFQNRGPDRSERFFPLVQLRIPTEAHQMAQENSQMGYKCNTVAPANFNTHRELALGDIY